MKQQMKSRAFTRGRCAAFVTAIAAALASQVASATDYTWTRGGANNNWDNAANWTPGAPPVTPPVGDTTNIIYSGTSTVSSSTSALRQSYTIDSMRFASNFTPITPAATFNVSNQSALLAGVTTAHLTIGSGGIVSDVTTFNINITKNTVTATADANLYLSADQTWALNAPAAGTGAITFSILRPIIGTAHVTKTGTGLLVLGNNVANADWSGGIDLTEGSIRTGGLTGAQSGQFGTGAITSTSANDVSITASTVSSAGGGGDRLFDNDLVLGGTGRLTFGGSFNVGFTANSEWQLVGQKNLGITFTTNHDGTVVGSGGLNKLGGGTLILNGDNTYTGPTNVNEGVLQVRSSTGLGGGTNAVSVGELVGGTVGAALELSNNITVTGRTLSVAGNGVVSLTSPAGVDRNAGALRNRGGNNTWTGLVTVSAPSTYIAVDAGELNLSGGIGGTGSARVSGAGLLRAGNIRAAGLQVDGTGRVQINSDGTAAGASKLGTLTLAGGPAAPTATLDLTNNALVLDYDAATTAADVRSLIIAGRAGGLWTGPGITSSAAASNPKGAIGYAEASSLTNAVPIFGEVDTTAVLVRYTIAGDTNLDGTVEFNDLVRLAQNYDANGSGKVWFDGDSNYDGRVDFDDLVTLAQNYNQGALSAAQFNLLSSIAGEDFANAFGVAAVPEPTAAGAGLAFAALLRRRSRK